MKKHTDKAIVNQLAKLLLEGMHPFQIRAIMGDVATKDLIRNTRRAIINRGEATKEFFDNVAAQGNRGPATPVIDLAGKVYGDRTVIEYAGDKKWRMECKCGEEYLTDGADIRRSADRSSDPYICDHIPAERFWSKVDKSPNNPDFAKKGCWIWTAYLCNDGYGQFKLDDKVCKAHRYSWTERFGEIPSDKELDHVCRNRACVNPSHLEPVSHRENVLRGNMPSIVTKRGHKL